MRSQGWPQRRSQMSQNTALAFGPHPIISKGLAPCHWEWSSYCSIHFRANSPYAVYDFRFSLVWLILKRTKIFIPLLLLGTSRNVRRECEERISSFRATASVWLWAEWQITAVCRNLWCGSFRALEVSLYLYL